jgi:predicted ATP-dependent endonuclease of OLD family
MRAILQSNTDSFLLYSPQTESLSNIYQSINTKLYETSFAKTIKELKENIYGDYSSKLNEFIKEITDRKEDKINDQSFGINGIILSKNPLAKTIYNSIEKFQLKKISKKHQEKKHIYIPMLRGVRFLQNETLDIYEKTTIHDYQIPRQKENNIKVFTGQTIHNEIKKKLLGVRTEQDSVRDYEKFLSENFFNNKTITITPDIDDKYIQIHIHNGDTRKIHDLGDGIQSIIINTYIAFTNKDNQIALFIEEPELTLHPGNQRVLIETLMNDHLFPFLQIFVTTHSNHFLDLTYEYPEKVSIYSFKSKKQDNSKKDVFIIKNVTKNREILDLLEIRNSSVFLANCVIWVEGVTDRMLIRKLIEIYYSDNPESKKLIEDFDYTITEYGGGNLENFDFAPNPEEDITKVRAATISGKNFLIADNDGNKSNKKISRRKSIEKHIGKDNFYDKHREIENLIPFKIYAKLIEKYKETSNSYQIELKENYKSNETKFNNDRLNNKNEISSLIKKYLINANSKSPDYVNNTSIKCLHSKEKKKLIMEDIIKVIDQDNNITLNDFGKEAVELINSILLFIRNSKN